MYQKINHSATFCGTNSFYLTRTDGRVTFLLYYVSVSFWTVTTVMWKRTIKFTLCSEFKGYSVWTLCSQRTPSHYTTVIKCWQSFRHNWRHSRSNFAFSAAVCHVSTCCVSCVPWDAKMSAIKDHGTDHRKKNWHSQPHYYHYFLILVKWSQSCPYARHKGICGSGVIAPHILNLGTWYRWVVNFESSALYTRGRSPPINNE
jgi:hypothetical protein